MSIRWTIDCPVLTTISRNKDVITHSTSGTTNGLFSTQDQGKNWQELEDELLIGNDTVITGIEVSLDGNTVYAFAVPNQADETDDGYIIKSTDGAKSWTKTEGQIPGVQIVSKFAFDSNGDVYTVLIQDNVETGVASSVYSSNDDGKTWTLEGTNNNKLLTNN